MSAPASQTRQAREPGPATPGKTRIAIAGIAIESSAYSPHRAGHRDFAVLAGPAVVSRYPFLAPGTELREAADWRGVFYARSIPGGQVQRPVYEEYKQRILEGLAALGPLEGVYLDVHGAMSVEELDDAEGDLVTAIREVVGDGPLIASPMDLHGNVSERFALAVDLPTCFRFAPHTDTWQTRERAARNLLAWLGRVDRPRRAWVR
ncbi:MAG: M81 family metallopeptidase, partial [Propionibacteriaceae bacterium]|nr:M81 family metallopeptidase [Propionibacteriaceae bacterium]